MMARTYRRRTDDDDETPLRDGEIARVPMMLRDSLSPVQRQIAALHDGKGGTPGRRNGFAFSRDVHAKDELAAAYMDHEEFLQNAYRGVADVEGYAEGSEGSVCTVKGESYPDDFGAPGHVRRVDGELVCVPDSKAASGEDHATTMDRLYENYDRSLERAYLDARKTTRRDPQGREEGTWEEEDDDDDDDNRSRDDDDNQIAEDHARTMDKLYAELDENLRNSWKQKP
jgi:hypothetical protein